MMKLPEVSQMDRTVLRKLALRKREMAHDPVNLERRSAWLALDGGGAGRPMVLAEHGGVCDVCVPLPSSVCECSDPWARGLEFALRNEIYVFETLKDDHVVENEIRLNWKINVSDYGVGSVQHHATGFDGMGARSWDPALKDLDADFSRLSPRTFSVDREATEVQQAQLEAVFGDILPVVVRGAFWWTMGMTITAIDLIGLEGLMLAMYDNPDGLHRLMQFLQDDHLAFARWAEQEGLLSLNNSNDYIGSGSMGYTSDLPQPGQESGAVVRMKDLWVLLESQETVGVGPELFETFIFPYQAGIARHFGKVYYGCCEPVHTRWHVLERIPNLARVSVSPWADELFMAKALGTRYVYSRKPNPALISTGVFDEKAIRNDLRCTLEAAKGCRLELIMKDVHTLNNAPDRLPRWVAIAREVIREMS